MFGGKKEEAQSVPVYTVPTVDRPYELLETVIYNSKYSMSPKNPLFELGVKAADIGADAVIALVAFNTPSAAVFIGTAIRYKD